MTRGSEGGGQVGERKSLINSSRITYRSHSSEGPSRQPVEVPHSKRTGNQYSTEGRELGMLQVPVCTS